MTQRRLPPPPPSRHYPRRESSLSRIQRMADSYEPREPEEPEVDWDPGPFDPEAHRPIHAQPHHFLVNQRAAGMSPGDFDRDALRRGTAHEMEHTQDRRVAERIAMDHLAEREDYYDRLEECMPEQEPNPISEPVVETPEYRIVPARYSKGNMAVHVTRREDGMGNRADYLARAIANGRYTHRERAYIMSPSAARRFHKLYQEGWGANFVSWDLISPTGETQERKHKRKLRFNGTSDHDDYDPSAVERKLHFLEDLAYLAHTTPEGSKAWSDDDFPTLVRLGVITERQVLAVRAAHAYLERHYDRWMEEQGDEQARMQAYAEMGYENNPSSCYVWVLDDGDRPLEGPYGPFSKDTAKQYARIGAKQGRHDRAVTVGQSLDGDIVRIYEGGTGKKLVANEDHFSSNPSKEIVFQKQNITVQLRSGSVTVPAEVVGSWAVHLDAGPLPEDMSPGWVLTFIPTSMKVTWRAGKTDIKRLLKKILSDIPEITNASSVDDLMVHADEFKQILTEDQNKHR